MEESDRLCLHRLVWDNAAAELAKQLGAAGAGKQLQQLELETRDPHGRTALMLAVSLGRVECARALVAAGADVNTECEVRGGNKQQFSCLASSDDSLAHVT